MPSPSAPTAHIKTSPNPLSRQLLTPEAIHFLTELHHRFNPQRLHLLEERKKRQSELDKGSLPSFPTASIARRDPNWHVSPLPNDLQKRWVEITGPTDRKMLINALNSGANVFMADFEDANSPTWENTLEGQQNLIEAIKGTLCLTTPEGKEYKLNQDRAVLIVRPRGWHLPEAHFMIDDEAMSAALFDFGLYFFHNAKKLIANGSGPYFYLPKLENHLEARLWNEVFLFAQQELKIPKGTIKATVLLETILAAFEMEEILYELREHSAGLNAGRWDYIFSVIKKFHNHKELLFPDRSEINMNVPFMEAYTNLLVDTCHRRKAHAMGGMAAFIPSRKDKALNDTALEKVREDKEKESLKGFDGTWVAHPDLVPIAKEIFEKALKGKSNQLDVFPKIKGIKEADLLNFKISNGKITEEGLRKNISISLQYLQAWLAGLGAVALYNLMEDAATAEISRAQLWQWVHNGKATLSNGTLITPQLYSKYTEEEMQKLIAKYSSDTNAIERLKQARQILDKLVLDKEFAEFMTLPAYQHLIKKK